MKKKSTAKGFGLRKGKSAESNPAAPSVVESSKVAELAVDLWKLGLRARKEGASERVLAACERADDRLRRMGFRLETLEGQPYDTNMRAQVVEHLDADEPLTVSECLMPAVYFNEVLIREAEIVTKGK